MSQFSAIIIAAGSSQRFGNANKLHARLESGISVIEQVIQTVTLFPFQRCVIVSAANDDLMPELVQRYSLQNAVNINSGNGIGSSIACGTLSLKGITSSGIAIFPGDMPFMKAETISEIATVFVQSNCRSITRPTHLGQPGHPVFFPARFANELCLLEGDQGASCIIRKNSDSTCLVETSDFGAIRDIDTRADLTRQ